MTDILSEDRRARYPSLIGQRVLITGGGSGIGAGFVEGFARQGAAVTFFDIAEADSRALIARLADAPIPPRFEHADITDIPAVQALIARLIAEDGAFDVLINNAANDDRHAVADVTEAYWDDRMAVNLKHLFFCAQAVAPGMRARGGGAIINMGSVSWHLALPNIVLYQTAKAAIEGLTRSLARDLGGDGVRVTCIIPGWVRTPRQLKWHSDEAEAELLAAQCLKNRLDPPDVAALAMFLASDDARLITAHSYFVDAGWR